MRSLSSIKLDDSQNPFGFSGACGINVFGGVQPSATIVPATEDVPLRCMPATMIAVLERAFAVSSVMVLRLELGVCLF
jgi:hypothetical protein